MTSDIEKKLLDKLTSNALSLYELVARPSDECLQAIKDEIASQISADINVEGIVTEFLESFDYPSDWTRAQMDNNFNIYASGYLLGYADGVQVNR